MIDDKTELQKDGASWLVELLNFRIKSDMKVHLLKEARILLWQCPCLCSHSPSDGELTTYQGMPSNCFLASLSYARLKSVPAFHGYPPE